MALSEQYTVRFNFTPATWRGIFNRNSYWELKLFSRDITLITLCFYFRTGPDTVVLSASEPSKEKEKQGFFRAIKKKKKKSQMVCCVWSTSEDLRPHVDALFSHLWASSAPLQKYKTIYCCCCCHVHHVYLYHQSCASVITDGSPWWKASCHQEMSFPSV